MLRGAPFPKNEDGSDAKANWDETLAADSTPGLRKAVCSFIRTLQSLKGEEERAATSLSTPATTTPRTARTWAAAKAKDRLTPLDIELPPLGDNGVEISVTHCGLCGSDVHLINSDGGYADFTAYALDKPQVCGHEVIGTVTGVGSAIKHLKPGQRAGIGWQNAACHTCEWCKCGDEQLCSSVKCTCCEGNIGGFADYIRIEDGKFAFAIPDALDSAKTAPLLCGGQVSLANSTRCPYICYLLTFSAYYIESRCGTGLHTDSLDAAGAAVKGGRQGRHPRPWRLGSHGSQVCERARPQCHRSLGLHG